MRQSKYILTADDYGACDFIDNGIIKAIKAGKINSVACFAVPFGKEDDLAQRITRLVELKKDFNFSIGLHFSLTAGRSNMASTFENGNSLTEYDKYEDRHYMMNAYNYHFWKVQEQELEEELQSQIERLQACLGADIQIDSISNHHGIVYMSTRLFRPYAAVAQKNNIPLRSPRIWRKAGLPFRNWDRWPYNPMIRQGLRLRLLDQALDANDEDDRLRLADEFGITYPTCLVDEIYGQAYPANIKALFESFNLGVFSAEFMFHLGDPEYRENKGLGPSEAFKLEEPWGIDAGYFSGREKELDLLMNYTLPLAPLQKASFRELVADDKKYPDWHL